MTRLNVRDAKTNLSKYLERVANGETILLFKAQCPDRRDRLLQHARAMKRPIGLAKNKIKISRSFFRVLSKVVLDDFEGES
jgi:hypothetical protein